MKLLGQVGILFSLCWVGTVIEHFLPFPLPASVIAMVLTLLLLTSGLLKVEHIREKSDFLLANMAFFFIPAGVSIVDHLALLKQIWLPLAVICLVSTMITFAATAASIRLTTALLRRRAAGRE
jgi:holin-like protein